MAGYQEFLESKRITAPPVGIDPTIDMTVNYIYGLCDPETGEVRYIGKSMRPRERLQNHMNEKSKCHRSHWLQSLKRRGLVPDMVILETVCGLWPWQESERYWIERGRSLGWDLTNNTSGGDGVSDLPKETRERMRQVWVGRKHSDEAKAKIGAASSRRRASLETRERMRKAQIGRVISWADKVAEAIRKLDPAQVDSIKCRLNAGELGINLAREFGVHRTTISKIKMGTYFDRYRKNLRQATAQQDAFELSA